MLQVLVEMKMKSRFITKEEQVALGRADKLTLSTENTG